MNHRGVQRGGYFKTASLNGANAPLQGRHAKKEKVPCLKILCQKGKHVKCYSQYCTCDCHPKVRENDE